MNFVTNRNVLLIAKNVYLQTFPINTTDLFSKNQHNFYQIFQCQLNSKFTNGVQLIFEFLLKNLIQNISSSLITNLCILEKC